MINMSLCFAINNWIAENQLTLVKTNQSVKILLSLLQLSHQSMLHRRWGFFFKQIINCLVWICHFVIKRIVPTCVIKIQFLKCWVRSYLQNGLTLLIIVRRMHSLYSVYFHFHFLFSLSLDYCLWLNLKPYVRNVNHSAWTDFREHSNFI